MMPPCSRPSSTLRAAFGGALRACWTATVRGVPRERRSGRRDGRLDRTTGLVVGDPSRAVVLGGRQKTVRMLLNEWGSRERRRHRRRGIAIAGGADLANCSYSDPRFSLAGRGAVRTRRAPAQASRWWGFRW